MDIEEFRQNAHELVDWMADYYKNIETYPVKSQVEPREIINQLPTNPPDQSEPFDQIMDDFNKKIMPGITHWQHPKFFAYFPANSSRISVLGEMLTSTLAAQCMIWETSPAATELEEQVMHWLRDMIGLPEQFTGVIQDTASTSTLTSLLTARENKTNFQINSSGLFESQKQRVYCSIETHSSIEKDVKIMGLGKENLRKVPVDNQFAMNSSELENMIIADINDGFTPLAVVATIGTTGSTAVDPLKSIGEICDKYDIWLHVDAALSGSALVLPEKRWMIEGIEYVDTFVFNPHKWLFTNFDCSAYFIKDPESLVKTFEIHPEYLKTKSRGVRNYRDWGIPLGRRFRALKLWFVIRHYGVAGIQEKIRKHINLANELKEMIETEKNYELLAPVPVNTVCFRFNPPQINDEKRLDEINEQILHECNITGDIYITHTKLNGKYTLRFVIGQTYVEKNHVEEGWNLIKQIASKHLHT